MSAAAEPILYAAVDDDLARRNAMVLAVAQALAGGNNIVIVSTASIIGAVLASDKSLATLPITAMVGSNFTTLVDPASTVTGVSKAMVPNRPRSVPETGFWSLLRSVASTATSARLISGSGRVVAASGFSIETPPVVFRKTSAQMPASRPRTVGIQSQPAVA